MKVMKDLLNYCFSPKWRINRQRYFFYPTIFFIIFSLIFWSIFEFLNIKDYPVLSSIVNYIVFFIFISVYIIVGIKRFRDIWISWWFSILLLIPIIWFLIIILLTFIPWEKWENKYWLDPREVKVPDII